MFKINVSAKDGKTYKIEAEAPELNGKSIGETLQGQEVSPDLAGYELEITGTSDKAGFTGMKEVEGIGLKKLLLTYGKAMHKRPRREGKKKISQPKPKGLRLRKTVRGKVISPSVVQINTKVLKEGGKPLSEIFKKPEEQETRSEQKAEEQKE